VRSIDRYFLDIPSKIKDTLKAWMDLEKIKLRNDFHHETLENGSKKLPTACYTLSKLEKMSLHNCLHGIKVPSGYSDNISRMVNMKTLKVHFKKSHDYHILLGQFLAIAIRGILPIKVRDTIIKLCSFFNAISQKVVDPMKLTKLQDDLILMMCNLKTIFPPSFFNLMSHLLVHIVHEMKYLGPVFLHQMYQFERFMTILRKYVRNRSHPECCIVQGWATKVVIEFVVDYMDLRAIGKPILRHEGRWSGKRTRCHTTFNVNDYVTYTQAYFTIPQQFVLVAPYVRTHVKMLRSSNLKKSEDWIAREHQNNFNSWLHLQIMDQDAGHRNIIDIS
jgi:hypothetical protein